MLVFLHPEGYAKGNVWEKNSIAFVASLFCGQPILVLEKGLDLGKWLALAFMLSGPKG